MTDGRGDSQRGRCSECRCKAVTVAPVSRRTFVILVTVILARSTSTSTGKRQVDAWPALSQAIHVLTTQKLAPTSAPPCSPLWVHWVPAGVSHRVCRSSCSSKTSCPDDSGVPCVDDGRERYAFAPGASVSSFPLLAGAGTLARRAQCSPHEPVLVVSQVSLEFYHCRFF